MNCTSDRCQQGKGKCPTPEACELPIQFVGPDPIEFRLIWWLIMLFITVSAISFLVGYFG